MGTVNFLEERYRRQAQRGIVAAPEKALADAADRVIVALVSAYPDAVSRAAAGDKEAAETLRQTVGEIIDSQGIAVRGIGREAFIRQVFDSIYGYGILQDLVDDPAVSDIFVNGPDNIWVMRNFKMERVFRKFKDEDDLLRYMHRILAANGKKINDLTPCVDARDPRRRLRLNCVLRPVNTKSHSIVIRKHPAQHFSGQELVSSGMFTAEMATFFRQAVLARANIIISGPTGSGKTTFLRYLASQVPHSERLVVIEDTEELYLEHPNCVSQETKKKQGENDISVTLEDLVVNALRMRPDRIILGELRDRETIQLLAAFGTGHAGGFATLHANSSAHAVDRLVFLMMHSGIALDRPELLIYVAEAVDLIIHVEKRRVVEVSEVAGYDYRKGKVIVRGLYRFSKEKEEASRLEGSFVRVGLPGERLVNKFKVAGLALCEAGARCESDGEGDNVVYIG